MNEWRYIRDAERTVRGLGRDLDSQTAAYQGQAWQDDIDAYERALETLKTAKSLWNDWDGVLVPYEEQSQWRVA